MSRSDRGDGALFALDAERPEGWFPVQNLKIHRARPVKRADGEHRPLQMGFKGVAKYNVQSARFLRGGMRASISGLRAAYPKRACGRSALRIFCKLAMRPKTFCRERS